MLFRVRVQEVRNCSAYKPTITNKNTFLTSRLDF